jgi:hypothetical protein
MLAKRYISQPRAATIDRRGAWPYPFSPERAENSAVMPALGAGNHAFLLRPQEAMDAPVSVFGRPGHDGIHGMPEPLEETSGHSLAHLAKSGQSAIIPRPNGRPQDVRAWLRLFAHGRKDRPGPSTYIGY